MFKSACRVPIVPTCRIFRFSTKAKPSYANGKRSQRSTRRTFLTSFVAASGLVGLAHLSTDRESPIRFTQNEATSSPDADQFDYTRLSSYTDPLRHSAIATSRSSRVVTCALLCFNDYRVVLGQNEKQENPDERARSLAKCHKQCAERVLKVMEGLGGIYIKLGQHVSAMSYLLPEEWTSTMTVLQDACPPSSIESLREMFLLDTGKHLDDVFSAFDPDPLGVASLAQVHRATLRSTGREVAIKFQHPSLREFCKVDLDTTRFCFQLIKRIFPDFSLTWLSDEMDISLPQELNFTIEGENAVLTRRHFQSIRGSSLYVPQVIWAEPRILVLEYIQGRRVDDLAYLAQHGIDRNEVSAELARAFNEMIFFAPALHCDPHGGNVFIRPRPATGSHSRHNFEIVLLDHGLYREIPLALRRDYARLWLAIIKGDEEAMRLYCYKVAGVKDDQFPLFASAITGRDYTALQKGISQVPRSDDELKRINSAVGQGLLQQLVDMLAHVPRILLLLLKTNDLTRALDESLQTTTGPERPFIILAKACTRVVYEEDIEVAKQHGSVLSPMSLWARLKAVFRYYPMLLYLHVGELVSIYKAKKNTRQAALAGPSPIAAAA
ncbi:ABC1 family protein-like protein [Protomyces lactucae-debilis]|uniref:ABC1 family protein-like protein n=1 Tax=Protomyces lactucae-debilis TaxID=2754530 RepID=A0A1Y2FGJ4_PROLT|nr:ABC1 family protein-like protein [Protomyces lactucae-debilis]ORY83060.1 ABC1 family protein-like protein [Protomyces lactucae-debilis]